MVENPKSGALPPPATLFHSGGGFLKVPDSTVNLDIGSENMVPFSNEAAQSAVGMSTEASAVLLISPRALQSQPGPDMFMELEEIETFVFPMDEGNQSVISIRVSRGKSQVNLSDPSRTYRRAGPRAPRALPVVSPMAINPDVHKSTVKFKSILDGELEPQSLKENQNQKGRVKKGIFPSPILEQPFKNLKSDYDFYTPGQTLEAVKDKLVRMKTRMSFLRDELKKKENSLKEKYLVADDLPTVAKNADADGLKDPSLVVNLSSSAKVPSPLTLMADGSLTGITEEQKAGSAIIPLETSDAGTSRGGTSDAGTSGAGTLDIATQDA